VFLVVSVLTFGLALVVLFLVIRPGVGGGPVYGRVIDADTNLPITGAIVVARWQKSSFSLADSTSYCIHVETAVSKEDGHYWIARWWQFPPILGLDGLIGMDAYYSGYESVHAHTVEAERHPEYVYMKKFVGSHDERFEYIARRIFGGMGCTSAGSSQRNLYPLLRGAFTEAKSLHLTAYTSEGIEALRRIAADDWLAGERGWSRPDHSPVDELPIEIRKELQ
jgi:hypothetical protein